MAFNGKDFRKRERKKLRIGERERERERSYSKRICIRPKNIIIIIIYLYLSLSSIYYYWFNFALNKKNSSLFNFKRISRLASGSFSLLPYFSSFLSLSLSLSFRFSLFHFVSLCLPFHSFIVIQVIQNLYPVIVLPLLLSTSSSSYLTVNWKISLLVILLTAREREKMTSTSQVFFPQFSSQAASNSLNLRHRLSLSPSFPSLPFY